MRNATATCLLSAKYALRTTHEPTLAFEGETLGAKSAIARADQVHRRDHRGLSGALCRRNNLGLACLAYAQPDATLATI